jgi:hypothetical protein
MSSVYGNNTLNTSKMSRLEDYQELLKKFITLYIYNLGKESEETEDENKLQLPKLSEDTVDRFYKYLDLMCELFKIKAVKTKKTQARMSLSRLSRLFSKTHGSALISNENVDKKYEELFKHLVLILINFNTNLKTLPVASKKIALIDMHGGFNFDNGFQIVPDNMVLVFMTPVNRYGFIGGCSKKNPDYLEKLKNSFSNSDTRQKIFESLSCLDKFSDRDNKNSGQNYKYALQEATVLYPGQYYFDLEMSYNENDKDNILGIYVFPDNVSDELQTKFTNRYYNNFSNSLSNIIASNFPSNTGGKPSLTYLFIDCCRNIDHYIKDLKSSSQKLKFLQSGKDIYTYENFMYFFNTIMSNCKDDVKSGLFDINFEYYENTLEILTKKNAIIRESINKLFHNYFKKYGYKFETLINNFINSILTSVYRNTQIREFIKNVLSEAMASEKHILEFNEGIGNKIIIEEFNKILNSEFFLTDSTPNDEELKTLNDKVLVFLEFIKMNKQYNRYYYILGDKLRIFLKHLNDKSRAAIQQELNDIIKKILLQQYSLFDLYCRDYYHFLKYNGLLQLVSSEKRTQYNNTKKKSELDTFIKFINDNFTDVSAELNEIMARNKDKKIDDIIHEYLIFVSKFFEKNIFYLMHSKIKESLDGIDPKIYLDSKLYKIKKHANSRVGSKGRATARSFLRTLKNNNINNIRKRIQFDTPLLNVSRYLTTTEDKPLENVIN